MIPVVEHLTFLVQALLLIKNDQLAVLVSLLEDVLALLDVAVVVLQAQEGGHQGHVGLKRGGGGGSEEITQHEESR